MNFLSLFTLIVVIYYINCAYTIRNKEKFYNELKRDKRGTDFYNSVIDNLKKILDYFVYIDLYKNPPQPASIPNYFPKVDTIARLEKIRSEINNDTYYYDFFRKIRFLIDDYRDAHMSYGLRGFPYPKIGRFLFLCPMKLITVKDKNNNIYMTGEIAFNESDYFQNGTEVFKIIKENLGKPIAKINGKTPFDFIQEFGGKFFKLKNPHANYAFQIHQYMSPFFIYFPFNEDEIMFNVEYENGAKFETEYAIAENVGEVQNLKENHNLHLYYNDINTDNEFMKYLDNYFLDNNYGTPKSLHELLTSFEQSKNIKNNLIYNNKNKNEFNYENLLSENDKKFSKINWDYEYNPGKANSFQCRVDEENELNVIHMPTFGFDNITLIIQLIKNCMEKFDTNEYKIVVILNFNGGGVEYVSQTLIEYIQPYITSRFYSTFRHGKYLNEYYKINFTDNSIVETCEIPSREYVINNIVTIDYGEGVKNFITKPFRRFGQHREEYNKHKKSLKHKRKPNEILIFTDGYSASSASLFTKSLQNEGGAIIVGYNGNPVSDKPFDGSQHFSSVFNLNDLRTLEKNLMKEMEKQNIYFTQICRTGNYFDYRELLVPEEYNIMEVDIVADIYEIYEEEKNYGKFMNKAKEIFKEFETKCNKNNRRLTLFDENCTFDDDKFAHGGHPCDGEGKWDMNKCQKVYCDEGYLMDYKEYKCVKDPCLSKNDSGNSNTKIIQMLIVLLSLIMVF